MQDRQAEARSRASMEERLKAGDRRFSRLEARLDKSDHETRQHLREQDQKIDALTRVVERVDQNTSSMVDTWNDGARAVRFFCRLAQGWRFVIRQVMLPVVIPLFALYAGGYYYAHGHFPEWLADTVKLILAIV